MCLFVSRNVHWTKVSSGIPELPQAKKAPVALAHQHQAYRHCVAVRDHEQTAIKTFQHCNVFWSTHVSVEVEMTRYCDGCILAKYQADHTTFELKALKFLLRYFKIDRGKWQFSYLQNQPTVWIQQRRELSLRRGKQLLSFRFRDF